MISAMIYVPGLPVEFPVVLMARVLGPEIVKCPFTRRARVPKQSEVYNMVRN